MYDRSERAGGPRPRIYFRAADVPAATPAEGALLARMDDELRLLKFEARIANHGVDPEVVAALWDPDSGTPARHRHARDRRAAA